MKTQSVEVLNEADDFEAKLRWILFKTEQDARMFGGPEEYDEFGNLVWRPGMALYRRPHGGYGHQYIRNMADVYDEPDEDDFFGAGYRCEDCETWWLGFDPCWVCGQTVHVARLEKLEFSWEPGMLLPDGEGPYWDLDRLTFQRMQRYAAFDFETTMALANRLTPTFQRISEQLSEIGRSMAHVSFDFRRYLDEACEDTSAVPGPFTTVDPNLFPVLASDRFNERVEGSIYASMVNQLRNELPWNRPIFMVGHSWRMQMFNEARDSADGTSNGILLPAELVSAIERGDAHIPTPALPGPVITNYDRNGEIVPNRRRNRDDERPLTERRRDYGG